MYEGLRAAGPALSEQLAVVDLRNELLSSVHKGKTSTCRIVSGPSIDMSDIGTRVGSSSTTGAVLFLGAGSGWVCLKRRNCASSVYICI
jgi:hypothetical protein